MIIDAAKTFRESPAGKTWADISASLVFEMAVTASLAHMQLTSQNCPDMATAAAWQWQMEGAKRFARTLLTITETNPEIKAAPPQNLQHKF